jgi:hypothetical protein
MELDNDDDEDDNDNDDADDDDAHDDDDDWWVITHIPRRKGLVGLQSLVFQPGPGGARVCSPKFKEQQCGVRSSGKRSLNQRVIRGLKTLCRSGAATSASTYTRRGVVQ